MYDLNMHCRKSYANDPFGGGIKISLLGLCGISSLCCIRGLSRNAE